MKAATTEDARTQQDEFASVRGSIDSDEIQRMLAAEGSELDSLLDRASKIRDVGLALAGRPGVVTYSRKVFLPVTTLCRDRCHYCTFVDTPSQLRRKGQTPFMSEDDVLAIARHGAQLQCKEALFTLGDRPEARWPEARQWLDFRGFHSTLDYVGHLARIVTRETGMLAHLNPGVMSYRELAELRPVAASMGMMLETTSRRLYETPGQVHFGSPDKDPDVRLRVLDDAGRARIPFTTGILVGIGETLQDRAESLEAINRSHRRYGHIQEVIVQNFRAKRRTAMQNAPDAGLRDYIATVATARVILDPSIRIQVPPNLSDTGEIEFLLRAGADDWGGVSPLTADHVNPERPWPQIDDLAAATVTYGFELRERLTVHPEYVAGRATWIDRYLHAKVAALADEVGLAKGDVAFVPPRMRSGVDPHGRTRRLIELAAANPADLESDEWVRLLRLEGPELDRLCGAADTVRRLTVGEAVSLVANRNVSSSLFGTEPSEHGFGLLDLPEIAQDAVDLGATELCIQGCVDPVEEPESYVRIARTTKASAPGIHLHAFGPREIIDFASRTGMSLNQAAEALRVAGVDTVPGTGVKTLSERVYRMVGGTDPSIDEWLAALVAAHRVGLRSSAVLWYGHVETAPERIEHLQILRQVQNQTNGITELVLMPHASQTPAVTGRASIDEHRAMFAVARLLLAGAVRHLQVPWTRLNDRIVTAALRSGADDLGGTLFDGRVLPAVGAEVGHEMLPTHARQILDPLFRPLRQRTTTYAEVPQGRRIL